MMLGWPIASAISGRMMLRIGYRPLARFGGLVSLAGLLFLAVAPAGKGNLAVAMLAIGVGMGFLATPYLVSVQNAVPWNRRGVVTSSNQFFRTIGGAIMVAVLGAVLNARLKTLLGSDANAAVALQPGMHQSIDAATLTQIRDALHAGLHTVFLICLAMGVISLAIALFFPAGTASDHAHDPEFA
jgi:MFS family permease